MITKMKKLLYITLASVVAAGSLISCSDNYLNQEPVTDISDVRLSDPSVAKQALAGLYEGMNNQYSGYNVNQNVGESTVNYLCGETLGNDLISGIWNTMPGLEGWWRMTSDTWYFNGIAWMYYYNIVQQANRLINAIPATSDNLGELSGEILLYKAEALTMRAHAYTRLLGYFGQRWEDSDNGEAYCIVLRTEPTTNATPLVTMNEILNLIYADCDEAVKLYKLSGQDRENKWEANQDVANGVWARAAMIKHDWATAAEKAKEARAAYKVMDETQMFAGFFTDCTDFIWEMNPTEATTYYWSWGSHYSCNGGYVNSWGYGAGAMNIDLYNQLDKNDLRRKYYWMPDKLAGLNAIFNPGKLKEDAFWNAKITVPTNFLTMTSGNVYNKTDKEGYGMVNCVVNWAFDYLENIYTGDKSVIAGGDKFYNYFFIESNDKDKKKAVRLINGPNDEKRWGKAVNVPFGAQCKFWSNYPYGNMAMPWMRASEMALIEAEAQCMAGNTTEAQNAFTELQSKRVAGYTCTSSGDALLKEIQISRRAELWGEGFAFTDMKRWNQQHIRRPWVAGDKTSGNVPPGETLTDEMKQTTWCNGWRFTIPAREYQYNEEIDLSKLKKF